MAERKAVMQSDANASGESLDKEPAAPSRPIAPAGVEEWFMAPSLVPDDSAKLVYRPGIYAESSLHFVRSSADLDRWVDAKYMIPCGRGVPDDLWESSKQVNPDVEWLEEPEADYIFSELPTDLMSKKSFSAYEKQFKDYLYRHRSMTLYKSNLLKEYAPGGLTEPEARNHFKQAAREQLDTETEKLRSKYADKMAKLNAKLQTAQDRVDREAEQYNQAKMSSMISFGASILGAFLGNKVASRTNVSKMGTAMRGASRAAQQKGDVSRAEDQLQQIAIDMQDLDAELNEELEELGEKFNVDNWELDTTVIPPRKSDLKVDDPWLIWTPWQVDSTGIAMPLFDVE
jgi:hypothetical protein